MSIHKYSYTAKDNNGKSIKGFIEADDEKSAALKIRGEGLWPLKISVTKTNSSPSVSYAGSAVEKYFIYPFFNGVSLKSLALFFRTITTLLASGMTVSESLRHLGSRTNGKLGNIIRHSQIRVENGGKLSDELARHPHIFSLMILSLLRAGESAGSLDKFTDKIASSLEYELSIRRMISNASFYPALVFLMIILIPNFPALFLDGGKVFLDGLWKSLSGWLPYVVVVLIIARFVLQFDVCKYIWDSIKIRIPFFGGLANKIAISRFARVFAIVYSAGMDISQCVYISAESSANKAIAKSLKTAIPALQSGKGVVESLTHTNALNPIIMDMFAIGERTGNYENVLNNAAQHMESECDSAIKKLPIMLFIVLILIAGYVILKMAIRFYLGYYEGLLG